MPPKKGVRFASSTAKSSSSNPKARPEQITTRTSPSRTRSGTSFHNAAVDTSSPGSGRPKSRRSSISRSPNSPPTPHPRASSLPKATKKNTTSTREVPYSAQNDPERKKALAAQRQKQNTTATQPSGTHSPPQKVVKRQASARQAALEGWARRRYEPILRHLWDEKEELLAELDDLQGIFEELAERRRMTIYAVAPGERPYLSHSRGDRFDDLGPPHHYWGFLCCRCSTMKASEGRLVVEMACWNCGHEYGFGGEEGQGCFCLDVYT